METATIGPASTPSARVPGSRRTPRSWARRGSIPPRSHPLRHAGGLWEHELCAPRSHNPPVVWILAAFDDSDLPEVEHQPCQNLLSLVFADVARLQLQTSREPSVNGGDERQP